MLFFTFVVSKNDWNFVLRGTMPLSRFLETTLKAPVVHLPLGQSSDSPHLANERIRCLNLAKGIQILKVSSKTKALFVSGEMQFPIPKPPRRSFTGMPLI